jgi:sugar-specific transcriptional regulator TrmB
MLEKYLQSIGLTDKESSVYLALVQVDNASVLDLSKKTKLKRPTVYVVLDSLSKKGLVSETTIGKKTHYQAEPPERLETFVERQKLVLDESSKRLKDIIPEIKSIQRESGERPVVKYFEGRDGILSMLEEVFGQDDGQKGEYIHVIYPQDKLKEIFTDQEREKYRNLRLKRNIKSKAIYTSSSERPSDNTSDRIQINQNKYPLLCDITIYKDRLSISILGKKLSGIFVQSQDLADTLRSLFGVIFDSKKQ